MKIILGVSRAKQNKYYTKMEMTGSDKQPSALCYEIIYNRKEF